MWAYVADGERAAVWQLDFRVLVHGVRVQDDAGLLVLAHLVQADLDGLPELRVEDVREYCNSEPTDS